MNCKFGGRDDDDSDGDKGANALSTHDTFFDALEDNSKSVEAILTIVKRSEGTAGAGVYIKTPLDRGDTPLYLAAQHGRLDVIKALVADGADVKTCDNTQKYTALHAAAENGHCEVIAYLISSGADAAARNVKGETPLHVLSSFDHLAHARCVAALVTGGAPINDKDSLGQTPLHAAVGRAILPNAVETLLAEGADANAASSTGETPLHLCTKSHLVVEVLLSAKADVTSRDTMGWTPLHCAAARGNASVIAALVERGGADITATDNDGKQPLQRLGRIYFSNADGDQIKKLLTACI